MQRLACPEEARATLHVVQRGRARRACFGCAHDRTVYLEALRDCAGRTQCAIHAYALMGNHVHLLLTSTRAGGPARLMPALALRYTRYLSAEYGHCDPVWEDRYDATPVHTRAQMLFCMRYVEENPVRAGLVRNPAAYRWSSHRANALGEDDTIVTPHPHYWSLGRSPEERRAAYAALFARRADPAAGGARRVD